MALYYSLPVYRDTYSLILLLFKLTKEFNREYTLSGRRLSVTQCNWSETSKATASEPNLFSMIDDTETHSAISELVLRLTKQIVMHNPIEDCRVNGSSKRWNGLPTDKSLFGVNGVAMPNGFLMKTAYSDNDRARGLPIGNLTSQWFGNFYLNAFDHYMKHTLKIAYYGRYVDDFVVVHTDRDFLKELIPKLETFLNEELLLKLHPKKRYLQHYSKGVSFLGTIIKQGALLTGIRTKTAAYHTILKWSRLSNLRLLTADELSQFRDSVNSYWGLMQHHSSYKLRKKMASRFSEQLSNRTERLNCYRKIKMRDYTLTSKGRAIPYVEWWKLFDN